MGFENIIRIFMFLFGASLQLTLLILMFQRKIHKKRELIFCMFTLSVLGWTLGIFISLFSGYLYQDNNFVKEIFANIALFSFSGLLPLMAHTLLYNFSELYVSFPFKMKYLVYVAIYIPTIIYGRYVLENYEILKNLDYIKVENIVEQFIPWACILFLFSILIIFVSYKRARDEDEKRSLYIITGILITSFILYIACFIFRAREIPYIGSYLIMFMQLITFLLPPIFAYYLYSYNYMEYFVKKGVIYTVLGILVITFYTTWLRPVCDEMEKKFQINFRMIEGLIVMAFVFFIDPLKRWIQELFNWIFFRERQYYRKIFGDLLATINLSTYLDLDNLLLDVNRTVSKAMKIKEVSIILFNRQQEPWSIEESTLDIDESDIKNVVQYIENRHIAVLNIYDLGEKEIEIQKEMKRMKSFTIIAAYNGNKLVGFLNLGKRLIRSQLLAEEEEMLMMLLHQMVTAVENTHLVREKFLLERKIYENEKLSSLGRLSASIAHEVKNPLSSIRTITQVTKEELPPDDPNQEGLTLIIDEVDRLSRVVQQLLRFASPHSRSIETIILNEVVHDVILLLKHEAERNNVIIRYKEKENIIFLSDRDALMEIFLNLVSNAIQALSMKYWQNQIEKFLIDEGVVTISHNIEEIDEDHSKIHIYVSDNGPGIPEQDINKIFEPFYTTKQSGTGLGLTIIQNRIKKLKGSIQVINQNPGLTFHIQFPMDFTEYIE
ncbi:MAG TPA: ATP-binding protein [Planctomycetota bacterium]|nr:ATP-binding protein [Planctomycetota bacterium]